MGTNCCKSGVAVVPISSSPAPAVGNFTEGVNIVWFGEKNATGLSTLRQGFKSVYAFESLNDSIEKIKSFSETICNCIYIIYDKSGNTDTIKPIISKISPLKQIRAILIYQKDKDILFDRPTIWTLLNDKQLINQINILAKELNVRPIVDYSKRNSVHFDREDMRIEIHENTFNAFLNTLENLKFNVNNELLDENNPQLGRKRKDRKFLWAVEILVWNMKISLPENNTNAPTNIVKVAFTATGKATLTSLNIPVFISNFELQPGYFLKSDIHGNATITFNSMENVIETRIEEAFPDNFNFTYFDLSKYNLASWITIPDLPGPVKLSQSMPIPIGYTTTDNQKSTDVSIVDFRMGCQHKCLILCLKLDYRTSKKQNDSTD